MPYFLPTRTWQTLKELYQRALPQKRKYWAVLLFSLVASATAVVQPLLYREAINDVVGVQVKATLDENFEPDDPDNQHIWMPHQAGRVSPRTPEEALQTLYWVLAVLLALSVTSIYFNYKADNLSGQLGATLEKGVVQRTFAHVLRLPLSLHDEETGGVLAKKVEQVDQISPVVTIFTRTLGPEVIRLAGIIAVMTYHSPKLTLITLLPLPLYLLFSHRLSHTLDSNLNAYYDRWQGISGRIVEVLAGIKTVKQSGAQEREAAHLASETDKAYALYQRREQMSNAFLAWEDLFVQCARLLVLSLGGWMVFHSGLTPGTIVMFVAYIDQLYDPIGNLTSVGLTLREHAISSGKALGLLRLPLPADRGTLTLEPGPAEMEFKGVHFGYHKGQPVLQGLSFKLKPGTVTALVGPSGAGKTTIVDLLTGLQQPWSGSILLQGKPLASVREQDLRREIAAVSADGAVFSGTLEWNIGYQRPGLPRAEALRAAKAAGLQSLLRRLPGGLQAKVGPGGHGLSVGERQRLQLARVLAARPGVLLLDEATANLDYANERGIKNALQRLKGQCTLLIVAHRWSMVSWADQVLVLKQGRLVQRGTPAALCARPGWLRHMATTAAARAKG